MEYLDCDKVHIISLIDALRKRNKDLQKKVNELKQENNKLIENTNTLEKIIKNSNI